MADVLFVDMCSICTEEVQDLRSVITITGFPAPDGLASPAASMQHGAHSPDFRASWNLTPRISIQTRDHISRISDVAFIRLSLLWGVDCLSVRLK